MGQSSSRDKRHSTLTPTLSLHFNAEDGLSGPLVKSTRGGRWHERQATRVPPEDGAKFGELRWHGGERAGFIVLEARRHRGAARSARLARTDARRRPPRR